MCASTCFFLSTYRNALAHKRKLRRVYNVKPVNRSLIYGEGFLNMNGRLIHWYGMRSGRKPLGRPNRALRLRAMGNFGQRQILTECFNWKYNCKDIHEWQKRSLLTSRERQQNKSGTNERKLHKAVIASPFGKRRDSEFD